MDKMLYNVDSSEGEIENSNSVMKETDITETADVVSSKNLANELPCRTI